MFSRLIRTPYRAFSLAPPVSPSLLKIVVGQIESCKLHENADSLYVSQVNMGPETIQICSGLRKYIPIEEMHGRRVAILSNLKPSKMRGEVSQAMVLAAEKIVGEDPRVDLITPPTSAPVGSRLYYGNFKQEKVPRLKPKVWTEIQAKLKTNSKGEPVYEEHILTDGENPCTCTLKDAVVR